MAAIEKALTHIGAGNWYIDIGFNKYSGGTLRGRYYVQWVWIRKGRSDDKLSLNDPNVPGYVKMKAENMIDEVIRRR